MAQSLHATVIPPLTHALKALATILAKAEAHAAAHKIDPAALLQARLFPDMFHLTRQVQVTCDLAKAAACRLGSREISAHADTETSFGDLQARIAKVIDLLAEVKPEDVDGGDNRTITFKVGPREMSFSGADYVTRWVNPNFYFHLTAAYAILRHNGLPLSKSEYLGLA